MTTAQFFTHVSLGIVLTLIAYGITVMMLRRVRVMDRPNERSSHASPIPKSGGVAIVVTFLIGMGLIYYFQGQGQINERYMVGFVFSALLIATISLIDDIQQKSPLFKLVTHIFAVVVVLYLGIVIDNIALPFIGYTSIGWVGYPLSFIWILGLTNANNFMDGLDGLVGGTAVIVAMFFMAISYYEGSSFVYITCYTILAGSLGFLFLNFPPARIFLGDVGSVFLGFVFATLAIIAARYDASHTSFLVMPLLFFNFIYDTAFTLIRRMLKREALMQPHHTHLYQLLHRSGYTHKEVTLIHYCMTFLQGLGALWMVQIPGDERLFVFIPFLLFQIAYTVIVIKKAKKRGFL